MSEHPRQESADLVGARSAATTCALYSAKPKADNTTTPALNQLPGAAAEIGRNDPCPCGSGQKFKRCCLGRHNVIPGDSGAGQASPPGTIRGAQNTGASKKGHFLSRGLVLDWLSVTFPTDTAAQQQSILSMLGNTFPLESTPYGGRGYTYGASFLVSGRVLWNPERLEMGVHLQMSAKVLAAAVELIPGFDPVVVLRNFVEAFGAKPTRIDLALDTDQDIIDKAISHFERGHVVTRAKGFKLESHKKFTPKGVKPAEMSGRGVYLGSRRSDTYVRVYDKGLEQGVDEAWYRVEFEYKRDNAEAIGALVLAGDFEAILGVMLSHLDFKKSDPVDGNRSRWETAKWWLALLQDAVKHKLCAGSNAIPTIEQIGAWLEKQVGPALTLYLDYLAGQGVAPREWLEPFYKRREKSGRYRLIFQSFAGAT
jgi:phage replication initiation protein